MSKIVQQAFSLIELLVGITILGMLCAIFLPELMDFYHRSQDEALLSRMLRTFAFAHHEAIVRDMPVAVCTTPHHQIWVFIDRYGDGTVKSKEQVLAMHQGARQGQLFYRAFPKYRDYILFTPQGWLANDNGTFWYCPQGNTSPVWAIVITKSGETWVKYRDKAGQIKDGHGHLLPC